MSGDMPDRLEILHAVPALVAGLKVGVSFSKATSSSQEVSWSCQTLSALVPLLVHMWAKHAGGLILFPPHSCVG